MAKSSGLGKHTSSGWLERCRNTYRENDTLPLPWLGKSFTKLIRSREKRGRAQDLRAQFGNLAWAECLALMSTADCQQGQGWEAGMGVGGRQS